MIPRENNPDPPPLRLLEEFFDEFWREFFALADTQFGFTAEKIEDKDDLSAFDAESGGYDSEKVHMYSMKRSKR